jgi:hypothetical protein
MERASGDVKHKTGGYRCPGNRCETREKRPLTRRLTPAEGTGMIPPRVSVEVSYAIQVQPC